jgi:GTP-binding protein
MLIDDVKIEVFSGKGGNGRVLFNKNKMSKGPTGGDGGNGGRAFLRGVSNIGALARFRGKKVFHAEDGGMGGEQRMSGITGRDIVLDVPVGTVVHILSAGEKKEITKIGEKLLLVEGGKGGRGNFFFRSSRNTTPKESEPGEVAKRAELWLELKLIADIGLIGLPNVGKSTLLNTVTNAKSRVANYKFTTLEPSLGVYFELILADIPGLIEGASTGKGLGIKFLKHVERTNTFFHLISAQSENPVKDYKVIRKELGEYNPELLNRKEYVFLSQSDLAEEKKIKKNVKALEKLGLKVSVLSVLDDKSIKGAEKVLREVIKAKKV